MLLIAFACNSKVKFSELGTAYQLLSLIVVKVRLTLQFPSVLKGIFQPFELGGETILIRSAVKH